MKILFDIVHPSDVFFFLRPIRALVARGHEVLACSRQKDDVCGLLDHFGVEHEPISNAANSRAGAAMELLLRDAAMVSAARNFRPHAMIGFGGVSIAHAGAALGIPSIAFFDRESAGAQTRLAFPAITKLFVPEGYAGDVPEKKTQRVAGVKALSYLHPDGFKADRAIAIENGFDPSRKNVFIKLGAVRTNQDAQKPGWSLEDLCAVVDRFRTDAKVHIWSDLGLPATLETYAFTGAMSEVHHLLGHCDIYVGESATLAADAAVLGVRSVHAGHEVLGYIGDLAEANLVSSRGHEPSLGLMELVEHQMARSDEAVKADWSSYVPAKPDWSKTVLDCLAPYAPVQRGLAKPKFRQAG
ncbi:MAG: DUF354 domain-containing protein [Pseudomonadota bacterium]